METNSPDQPGKGVVTEAVVVTCHNRTRIGYGQSIPSRVWAVFFTSAGHLSTEWLARAPSGWLNGAVWFPHFLGTTAGQARGVARAVLSQTLT